MRLVHALLLLVLMVFGLGIVTTNRSRALAAEQQARRVLVQMETQEQAAEQQLAQLRTRLRRTKAAVAAERLQRHEAELRVDKARVLQKMAETRRKDAVQGKVVAQRQAAELRSAINAARKQAKGAKDAAATMVAAAIPHVTVAAVEAKPTAAQPSASSGSAATAASTDTSVAVAAAAPDTGAWRTEPWFAQKKYCDGYICPTFKAAAEKVKDGDKSPAALARWLYPMFSEHSAGVSRIEGLVQKMHAFFAKHGLHYALYAGSLIGALRHDGVIPFDTDADVQVPVDEFKKIAGLQKEIEAEMGCRLIKGDMSFIFMGDAAKKDVWPVYETWAEAKAPEGDGPPKDPNRPWVSVKYWRDDNMPRQDIIDGTLHKFGSFDAYIPAKAKHYVERLYGKNVLTTVKVWNDDFNLQHCNNCDWSPNSYVVPLADFQATFKRFKDDSTTRFGC